MILTNNEIYIYAQNLLNDFGPSCDIKLPVKINFFLQKNIKILVEMAQDIDNARLQIAQTYGVLAENGSTYNIPNEKLEEVGKELNDLFALTQEVPVYKFSINDFNNIELSYKQMSAIMFMIEED